MMMEESGLVPHINMETRLPRLKGHPEFNQLIKLAIEKLVQEWIVDQPRD